jgi:hypothetical protein
MSKSKLTPQYVLSELYRDKKWDDWGEPNTTGQINYIDFKTTVKVKLGLTCQERLCRGLWLDLIDYKFFKKVNKSETCYVDLVKLRDFIGISDFDNSSEKIERNESSPEHKTPGVSV